MKKEGLEIFILTRQIEGKRDWESANYTANMCKWKIHSEDKSIA